MAYGTGMYYIHCAASFSCAFQTMCFWSMHPMSMMAWLLQDRPYMSKKINMIQILELSKMDSAPLENSLP